MKQLCLIIFMLLISIQTKVFADIGLGGKLASDFVYVYKLSGDAGLLDGLSKIPEVANLAMGTGFSQDGRKNSWIPWGAGFSVSLGSVLNPVVLELLIGRNPRNDLQTRFSIDWHLLAYAPYIGEKLAFQLFLGTGGSITTYYDTQDNDFDAWDNILAFRIPTGFKIFLFDHFEIFTELIPQVGWRYSYLQLKDKESMEKDKDGFMTISNNSNNSDNSNNVTTEFNYLQTGLSVSLGMHYWFKGVN